MTKIINFLNNNKVGLFIAILFISIFYLVYSNFKSNQLNSSITNIKAKTPYIVATKWSTIIKRDKIITIHEKWEETIKLNDKIRTLANSTATIFWPDWSITRLWNKTSITINELNTSNNLSTYKINFNIESGRTWSNIIKFLTDKSYFTETYNNWNFAATARWTVFEIDLDNNYIHAVNHDITILSKNNNENYSVKQWEIFKTNNLKTKLSELNIDKDWVNRNINDDAKYLNNLMQSWQNKLVYIAKNQTIWTRFISYLKYKIWYNKDDYLINKISESLNRWNIEIIKEAKSNIPELSEGDKQKLNSKLLNIYEWIHYLPNSPQIANYKSEIRDLIIQTWDKETITDLKDRFIKLDIYDYIDVTKTSWEKQASILKANINKYLSEMKDSEKIKNLFSSFSWEMLNILKEPFGKVNDEINKIIESGKSMKIKDKIQEWIIQEAENIKDSFDSIIWWIKNKIWN